MKKDFYKSRRWELLRSAILRRDGYMCQYCKMNNKRTNATCVHHVFPLQSYPQYALEHWNLMSLCDNCHDEMHNHFTGELSKKGTIIMRSVAAVQGIPVSCKEQTILVVGLRGCGKSTYCKNHMDDNTLVYDLDAIASAFRLKMPHEEYFKPARRMANDFLKGFIIKAHEYAKIIYIIRTAPTIKELEDIDPNTVVFCRHQYLYRPMDNKQEALIKLEELEKYCRAKHIDVVVNE